MNRYRRLIAAVLAIANLSLLPLKSFAQSNTDTARVVEAAKYLALAEEEFNCDISAARKWVRKSESALNDVKYRSTAEAATAAVLRARVSATAASVEKRRKALHDAADEIPDFLNSRLVSSALRSLDRVDTETPTCDPQFKAWRRSAEDRHAAAEQLVREGDRWLSRTPKEARKLFEQARSLNREEPGIEKKIQTARDAARTAGAGNALKAVGWIAVIAGLVATGKYMEKQSQKKAAGQTAVPVRSPY